MKRFTPVLLAVGLIILMMPEAACEKEAEGEQKSAEDKSSKMIELVEPLRDSKKPLEKVISDRRSTRNFDFNPISPKALSTLCWAGQGITSPKGYRAAPSAGALYPIFLYVALGENSVKGMDAGVYLYHPREHVLEQVADGDLRRELAGAALGQMWMSEATAMFMIAADYSRTTKKYGKRGIRYVHIEAGHVGQDILLETVALGLGACPVGAFNDKTVKETANLRGPHKPLLFIPVGHHE